MEFVLLFSGVYIYFSASEETPYLQACSQNDSEERKSIPS